MVDYNIEFGHLYLSKIEDAVKNGVLKKSIELAKLLTSVLSNQGKSYSLNVLLDDYNTDCKEVDKEEIKELYRRFGLVPDHIVLESKMVESADNFLKYLPPDSLFSKDNSLVYHSQSTDIHFTELLRDTRRLKEIFLDKVKKGGVSSEKDKSYLSLQQQRCHSNNTIVLVYNQNGQVRYGCPLLAACWHLSRLGIEPFYTNIQTQLTNQKSFTGKQILTILPNEYMKVESTALELIGLSKTKTIKKCRKRMEYFFV